MWQALLERDYQRCCEHQADAATQYRHLFERRQEALVMKRSSVEVRGLGDWAADSPVVDLVANRGSGKLQRAEVECESTRWTERGHE